MKHRASVLANDSDPDTGDILAVQGIDTTGTLGLVVDNTDGTFDYDPNGQFESLATGETTTDTFAYTVGDGNGGTDTATVSITIDGVNDHPVASVSASANTTAANEVVTLDATASFDPDASDILSYAWDLDDDGAFDDATGATTDTSFSASGTYAVTVQVTDQLGATDEASVSVTVDQAGAPPVAENDTLFTRLSKAGLADVLANDAAAGNGSLGLPVITTQPTSGAAVVLPDGRIVYAAEPGVDSGSYTFDYQTSTAGGTDTATFTAFVISTGNPGPSGGLFGSGADEDLLGAAVTNLIRAGGGNDNLLGGTGADQMFGGTGKDTILGGPGQDNLTGGTQAAPDDGESDLFILSDPTTFDFINGFDADDGDRLVLAIQDLVDVGGFVDTARLNLQSVGSNTLLQANIDPSDGDFEATLAVLNGVAANGLTIEDVVDNLMV